MLSKHRILDNTIMRYFLGEKRGNAKEKQNIGRVFCHKLKKILKKSNIVKNLKMKNNLKMSA